MPTITELLGRVLKNRYRLEAGLGTGASAHVLLAYDLDLARYVAVKLLHPGLANDELFLRKFRAEARAAAALNHPNIVQIYDWGEDGGEPFLVLEYLSGGSLRDLLDDGAKLGLSEVAQIGAQTARGLEYAHQSGLVHRDIKPANLLFDEAGVIHVADFGLARAFIDAPWTEPVGIVFGTTRYASPEQARGANVNDRSDVYSLALVCYEVLTGERPFSADTPLATLMARVDRPLPLLPQMGRMAPILAAATTSDPTERSDAASFAGQLERLLATLPAAYFPTRKSLVDTSNRRSELPEIGQQDDTEVVSLVDSEDEGIAASEGNSRSLRSARHRLVRRFAIVLAIAIVLAGGATALVRYGINGNTVPSLSGKTVPVAERLIRQAGLHVGRQTDVFSASVRQGLVTSQSVASGHRVGSGTVINFVVSKGHVPIAIPSVAGKTETVASTLLRAKQFVVREASVYSETVPTGTVVASTPTSGTVAYGSTVTIQISRGPQPRTIPNLSGDSYADASKALVALRLVPRKAQSFSTTVPSGEVISSQPAFGATGIVVGSTVTVNVSKGPQLVAVPAVAGESIADAVSALQSAGLVVSEQIGPPFATNATATDPAAGSLVRPGSDVTLYVA